MMFDLDCTLLAEMDEILIGEVVLDEAVFNFSGDKEELTDLVLEYIKGKVPVPLQEMFREDEIIEESFENEVEDAVGRNVGRRIVVGVDERGRITEKEIKVRNNILSQIEKIDISLLKLIVRLEKKIDDAKVVAF